MALGTLIPLPFTGFDDDGDPVPGGKLYTYEAGTTTPLATYSDSALTAANANPVVLDAAGRATIFAQPASYKLVLKTSADVTLWTRDNVVPYAPFSVDTTISGTAGETLAANSVCYLSDGTGGRTAGQWYLADADTAAYATTPVSVGIAPSQILIGASGSIRIGGRAENLSGLTAGTTYYVSGTAGALTSSAPANARIVGVADSTTSLVLADSTGPVPASRVTAGTFGSGDFTFSGVIKGSAGSAATPAIILNGDTDTGLYQTATNGIGVAAGGVLVAQFTGDQVRVGNGSAATPAVVFTSDPDTGVYQTAANGLGIAAGGALVTQFTGAQTRTVDGSAAAPSYSFTSDVDTGMYSAGANSLGLASAGALVAQIKSGQVLGVDGTEAAPTYSFTSDPNTGIMCFSGGGSLWFVVDGVLKAAFGNAGEYSFKAGSTLLAACLQAHSATTSGNEPGLVQLDTKTATPYYVWVDTSGNMRLNTSRPGSADTSGTVVGTQTSSRDSKHVLGPADRVALRLDALSAPIHDFTYRSGAFNGERFSGIVTDDAPRFGMDRDEDHPHGKSLNVPTAIGALLATVQLQQDDIDELRRRVSALEARLA